jgi:hypothetical protein
MIRWIFLSLLFTATTASAGVFPPLPRLPNGVTDELRPATPPAKPMDEGDEDPAKIAERIVAKSSAAGDRLKEKDSGKFTQKTQKEILEDIDKLLKPNDNPPPPMSENNPDGSPPDSPPMGGGSPMGNQKPMNKPMGGMGQGSPKPMGGQSRSEQRKEAREREDGGMTPMGPKPMPMGEAEPKEAKPVKPMPNSDGNPMGGDKGQGAGGDFKSKPGMPLDDAVTKQIWGHLPDRLRQEMNQYYKEQFMPKYNDMLRQYYSRLAEREKAGKK